MISHHWRSCAAAVLAATFFASSHAAQAADTSSYPNCTITVVVPFAAGGPVDSIGRLVADKLAGELQRTVVVENRAGASGTIGAAYVASAAPDGCTLYVNASIHAISPLLYKDSVKYDAVKDFTAIGMLAQMPLVFLVNPQVDAATPQAFAALVKSDPSQITFGTGGFGAADHLASSHFLHTIGMRDVPIVLYKGGAPALQDLVGGFISAKMDATLTALPLVRAGRLKPLAVTGAARSPHLPEVPTMKEAGYPDFEFLTWYGLWAPAGLPAALTETLGRATARVMAMPDVQSRLQASGISVDYRNATDFAAFVDSEIQRYQAIITAADIKPNS